MRLSLYQGAPVGATVAGKFPPQGARVAELLAGTFPPGGSATLQIDGVTLFKQEHTTYVAFESERAMKNAFAKTGWAAYSMDQLMLEASSAVGIGRMVIIANGIAYQSHSLES